MIIVHTNKHKNPLKFEYEKEFGLFVWRDKRKNIYSIQIDNSYVIKPIWIGRLFDGKIWCTWERVLGVERVDFPFGFYIFGKRL